MCPRSSLSSSKENVQAVVAQSADEEGSLRIKIVTTRKINGFERFPHFSTVLLPVRRAGQKCKAESWVETSIKNAGCRARAKDGQLPLRQGRLHKERE
jgi:hypothetical protein